MFFSSDVVVIFSVFFFGAQLRKAYEVHKSLRLLGKPNEGMSQGNNVYKLHIHPYKDVYFTDSMIYEAISSVL